MSTKVPQERPPRVTRAAIRRAVASSTAIETGQSVQQLEQKLKSGACRVHNAKLAVTKPR